MTIYYTLTFGILVTEMVMFGILVLPLPSHWRRAMLKFISTSPAVANILYVLKIVFGFIFVLFIDTVNRLQRIGVESDEEHHHDYSYEANLKAKKFYAQRNLYLTGFTLFLSLILERTSTLVIQMLKREEELEIVKQDTAGVSKDQEKLIKEVEALTKRNKELEKRQLDFDTLKKQAGQQAEEYNRLADERNTFEKTVSGQKDEPKKSI
ncbi:B-cell receptor-associated protein 31-like-domain-containing protein [Cunninghamella echinulata]|nr:B-cell receptor-associated protein 31-like-domain-containing protein [Cunninghamella echinulata]